MYNSKWKSALLHLRIPFSFYLLPVFLFALSEADTIDWTQAIFIFFILHVLVYPASNGYNSYFDKDEGPIGGLKNPPPVDKNLYLLSLALDFVALICSYFVSIPFMGMVLVYGLISKAYSHPATRWKKHPIGGWLAAGIFQGYFTFIMVIIGVCGTDLETIHAIQTPAILSSLLLLGSYPMTQVYQHEEDRKRGDQTISLKLGIRGTFFFTLIFFTVAIAGFMVYYWQLSGQAKVFHFIWMTIAIPTYFLVWFYRVWHNETLANYRYTMNLNLVSSLCFNMFFASSIWLF